MDAGEGMRRDRLLLLHTVGARTGAPRTTPVMFFPDGDRVLVVASDLGSPRHPDWYHNLLANPGVGVETADRSYPAVAVPLQGEERERAWERVKGDHPFLADQEAATSRPIPVVALEPGPQARPQPTGAGVLAVVDMQRVFADAGSPWRTPGFADLVAPVTRLAEAFGPRTVFTRFIAAQRPSGAWSAYFRQWSFAVQPAGARLYELVDAFAANAGATLDVPGFSKWTPELAARVGAGGRLVLAGVSTDCCVLSTALAAADAGTHVQVVADACAGVDEATHRRALDIMRLYGPLIEVVELAAVLPTG